MFKSLCLCVDRRSVPGPMVAFTAAFAERLEAQVQVLHVVEFAGRGCAAPTETPKEAEWLVEQVVFDLRMAGIGAAGMTRRALRHDVDVLIVESARRWGSDALVLGHNHARGIAHLFGRGVRERVTRRSPVPVIVAPIRSRARTARLTGLPL